MKLLYWVYVKFGVIFFILCKLDLIFEGNVSVDFSFLIEIKIIGGRYNFEEWYKWCYIFKIILNLFFFGKIKYGLDVF